MWVIVTLTCLIGLVILVLCVPLDAVLTLDTSEKPRFRLKLAWLFGLVNKELPGEKKKSEEKRVVKKKKEKKKRRFQFRTILKILRTRGLLKQLKNLIKGIIAQFKIKELTLDFEFGLEDPADTGLAFAVIGPAISFLNLPHRYRIAVQPSFSGEDVFDGYLKGILRVQPIRLTVPLLRFIFSLTTLRIAWIFAADKWKRKK